LSSGLFNAGHILAESFLRTLKKSFVWASEKTRSQFRFSEFPQKDIPDIFVFLKLLKILTVIALGCSGVPKLYWTKFPV
jgi:hypothetical protein